MIENKVAKTNEISTLLNSPQLFFWAIRAKPTAVIGKTARSKNVLKVTIPRFEYQRTDFFCVNLLRGPNISQTAIRARIPKKKPRRITGSFCKESSITLRSPEDHRHFSLFLLRQGLDKIDGSFHPFRQRRP